MAVPHTQDIAGLSATPPSDLTGPWNRCCRRSMRHTRRGPNALPNCVLEAGGQPASFTGQPAAPRVGKAVPAVPNPDATPRQSR